MLVPAGNVRVLVGLGGLAKSLVNGDIGLRGRVATNAKSKTIKVKSRLCQHGCTWNKFACISGEVFLSSLWSFPNQFK